MTKSILRQLIKLIPAAHVPIALDVVGLALIAAAALVAFGVASALLAAGVAILVVVHVQTTQ